MKSPAKSFVALLLGSSFVVAAAPAFAQTADSNPPVQSSDTAEGSDDQGEGWGWGRRHKGGHGGGKHDGRHGGGHDGQHRGSRGGPMMIIDANADGVIGADEAASLAEGMFMRHDRNRDEVLDEAEFIGPMGHGGGWRGWWGTGSAEAEAVQKVRKDKFTSFDADKSGTLSKAEIFAEMQQKLASADADRDGKVTPWEFRALPRM